MIVSIEWYHPLQPLSWINLDFFSCFRVRFPVRLEAGWRPRYAVAFIRFPNVQCQNTTPIYPVLLLSVLSASYTLLFIAFLSHTKARSPRR